MDILVLLVTIIVFWLFFEVHPYLSKNGQDGKEGRAISAAVVMEYRIIFDVKEGSKTVVFSKDFQELQHAFDWAEWFQKRHAWVNEYKIKPMFEKRRSNKR